MRWLCRSVAVMALVAVVAPGCGSTTATTLIFQFVNWDNSGLTQEDSVGEASAEVDSVQDCCMVNLDGSCGSIEPFTPTLINAVFINEQGSDIKLEGYTIHFDDPNSGIGDIEGSLSANIIGGRCSVSADTPCGTDADCAAIMTNTGGGATMAATCTHAETTVSGIHLFAIATKVLVNPALYGFQTSITVTFFGSDPNQSFQTDAHYVVEFGDFDHCTTSTGGTGA